MLHKSVFITTKSEFKDISAQRIINWIEQMSEIIEDVYSICGSDRNIKFISFRINLGWIYETVEQNNLALKVYQSCIK